MGSIFLGLLAAALYGSADFVGGFATKRSTMLSVTVISQLAGLAVLLVLLPFFPAQPVGGDILFGALAGLCGGFGIALLYHALSIGRMGIVSPITAVLSAALPVAFGLLHGDALGPLRLGGIGIALVAIVLISTTHEPDGRSEYKLAGVREALFSGLLLGGFYVFIGFTHRQAGLDQLVAARAASVALLTGLSFVLRQTLRPAPGSLKTIIGAGVLDMTANALFVAATYSGYLSVAAVLTSLYPAATVFLAFVVLKERLSPLQIAGVALAIGGVVLIGL